MNLLLVILDKSHHLEYLLRSLKVVHKDQNPAVILTVLSLSRGEPVLCVDDNAGACEENDSYQINYQTRVLLIVACKVLKRVKVIVITRRPIFGSIIRLIMSWKYEILI